MEVLIERHPAMCIPDLTDPECSYFEEYDQETNVLPLGIYEGDVEWVATWMIGTSGPSGIDVLAFQRWLLRFRTSLASQREDMAAWTD